MAEAITPATRVADVLRRHPRCARVFERHQIDHGRAHSLTLAEVASGLRLPPEEDELLFPRALELERRAWAERSR